MNKSKRLKGIEELLGIRVSEDGERYVDNVSEVCSYDTYNREFYIPINSIALLRKYHNKNKAEIQNLHSIISKLTARLEALEQHLEVECKVIPSVPETIKHVKIEKKGNKQKEALK